MIATCTWKQRFKCYITQAHGTNSEALHEYIISYQILLSNTKENLFTDMVTLHSGFPTHTRLILLMSEGGAGDRQQWEKAEQERKECKERERTIWKHRQSEEEWVEKTREEQTQSRERGNRRTEKEIAKTRRQRKQRATAPESIMIFHTCFGQKVQALYQYLK